MSSERPISDLPETGDDGCTADAAAQRLDLEEALRTLSATDRAVLVARYYDDLAIEEIAEAMRKNPAAVRRQASRALAKLRTVLGGQPVVEGEKSC
jgi:RNA polymerase sigma factor (sigma-70 family)